MKGKVELFTNSIVIKELGVGEPFGEISFFSGKSRGLSAKSKDFTTLFSINREEFIKVLKKNTDDYEKFCMIQDQILLYGNYLPLKIRCFSCNQIGHLANDCQLIHFLPDKEKIIKAHNYYLDQERDDTFSRRKMKKNIGLCNKMLLQTACRRLRGELQKEKDAVMRLNGAWSLNSSEHILTDLDNEFNDDMLQINEGYFAKKDHTCSMNSDKNNEGKIYEEVLKEKPTESQTNSFNELAGISNKSLEMYNVNNIPRINLNNENNSNEECNLRVKEEISMKKIPEDLGLQRNCHTHFMENDKNEVIKIKKRFGTEVFQVNKQESSMNIMNDIRKSNKMFSHVEDGQFFEGFKANPNNLSQYTEELNLRNKEENYDKKTTILSTNFSRNNTHNKFSLLQKNLTIVINRDKIMDYFETVTNFKNYFPENNSKVIFEGVNKTQPLRRYNKMVKVRKKSLDQRIAKYTFFPEDMKEKMPSAIKKKAMRVKRNQRLLNITTLKSMGKNKSRGGILEKKSFFTDSQIMKENKFSDVVKLIMGNPGLKKQLKKNLKP